MLYDEQRRNLSPGSVKCYNYNISTVMFYIAMLVMSLVEFGEKVCLLWTMALFEETHDMSLLLP